MSPTYRFPIWRRLAPFARRTVPEDTPEERLAAWLQCETSLRNLLASHIGEKSAQERFVIPSDYVNFMIQIGGGWGWNDDWEELLSLARVAGCTEGYYEMYVIDFPQWTTNKDTNPLDYGLWMNVGYYGCKHEQSLCCDRQHSLFGHVVDCHDYHPWMGGVSSSAIIGASFTEYLEFLARRVDPDDSPPDFSDL